MRRSDVSEREIGLVFGLDANENLQTLSGKLAGVYSFLPIEGEQTGLPFGIFGDFIPQPGRDLINYGARWNVWMSGEVVQCFQQFVREVLIPHQKWILFCPKLLADLRNTTTAGPGEQFWKANLREPIKKFLESESLYPDAEGTPRTVGELMVVEDQVARVIGRDTLEKAIGKKFAHLGIQSEIRASCGFLDIYSILREASVLKAMEDQPRRLAELYRMIGSLSSYVINGRQGRDTPLSRVAFVLGEDGQFYTPEQITMIDVDVDQISDFLRFLIPKGRLALHPEIAKDTEAVSQLKQCGLSVVENRSLIAQLLKVVDGIRGSQSCPPGWKYPEDIIRATIFLAAEGSGKVQRLVAQEGTLEEPTHLFVPGTFLDWFPLWDAHLLPGFQPIRRDYFKEEWLTSHGVQKEGMQLYLKDVGVHGFEIDKEKSLIQTAAEAIAKEKPKAHQLWDVTQRDRLGYDLECKGHCAKVFEVKGMNQPRDEVLPESETNAAQQRGPNYVLIFVYNLPARPDAIGYKEIANPANIWEPVERARLKKDKWLSA